MKYTYESLNEAIFKIIPQFNNGYTKNQPMMLISVANKYFIDKPKKDNVDYEEMMDAYAICRQASIDLSVYGYFNFSDKE